MLKGLRESPLPASLSVYFDNESSAHRQAARRKEILRLLYAAYCAGLRAYLALRQNAAALKRLADDVSIGVLRFDKVGRVVSENEFFQRLMCTDPNRDFVRSEIVRKVHGLIAIATHASTQRQMSFDFPTRAGRYRVLPAFLNGVSGEDCGCLIALVERFRPQRMTTTEIASRFSLTQRELECALLLSHGLSSRDMAQRLGISINTARRHVERIFLKLDVHNRVAAVAKLTALSLFWFLGDLGELLTMSTVC
ncbi:MAG TPA: helix-turn-helix transcriptional regulator [Gemmatimonadaceae bacterium]|nr:helix-turn-helix transcriptional regulator [Gemmatimonadaceae bacterium]